LHGVPSGLAKSDGSAAAGAAAANIAIAAHSVAAETTDFGAFPCAERTLTHRNRASARERDLHHTPIRAGGCSESHAWKPHRLP
jgi:hypothetical protein